MAHRRKVSDRTSHVNEGGLHVPQPGHWLEKGVYTKCFKILYTSLFLFSNKMLVTRAEIHKISVRIASREDPGQTASSAWSGSALFAYASLPFLAGIDSVRNFRTSTVCNYLINRLDVHMHSFRDLTCF